MGTVDESQPARGLALQQAHPAHHGATAIRRHRQHRKCSCNDDDDRQLSLQCRQVGHSRPHAQPCARLGAQQHSRGHGQSGLHSHAAVIDGFAQAEDPAAEEQRVVELHPLKRIGTPGNVGVLVAFLASDDACYITGTEIVIDGGISARYAD